MKQPWFIAVERFGPANGEAWRKYIEWAKLIQLQELVSLDTMLCPTVLKEIRDTYWPHIVNENYYLHYFTDLDFLRREVTAGEIVDAHFLCVFRNPVETPILAPELNSFSFRGYDLVEAQTSTSALSHCGGWPELNNGELSSSGLLTDHARALQLQEILPRNHPEEPHADCDVWAIFAEGA